jgi:hypothetical protein
VRTLGSWEGLPGGDTRLDGEVVLMAPNPYEPKGFTDKWSWPALLVRGVSELFGGGRKRRLTEQAEKANRAEREERDPTSPESA